MPPKLNDQVNGSTPGVEPTTGHCAFPTDDAPDPARNLQFGADETNSAAIAQLAIARATNSRLRQPCQTFRSSCVKFPI